MINLKDLTVIFNYHKDKKQLEFVMNQWGRSDKQKHLNFIVCNTGPKSDPIDIDFLKKTKFNIKVLELDNYKPFNMPLGKNVSVKECITKWMFITDPDRFLSSDCLDKITNLTLDEDYAYDFQDFYYDVDNDCILKPSWHPNTFLITKNYYESVSGYNEIFCGNYGYDDTEFRSRMKIARLNLHTYHHHLPEDRVRDSSKNLEILRKIKFMPIYNFTDTYKIVAEIGN